MKDAFDLWWEWAQKPHESMLMISGDIHYPVMELSPEDRHDREKVNEASDFLGIDAQHLNRIGRRTVVCMRSPTRGRARRSRLKIHSLRLVK
jgi:hypothetical protein